MTDLTMSGTTEPRNHGHTEPRNHGQKIFSSLTFISMTHITIKTIRHIVSETQTDRQRQFIIRYIYIYIYIYMKRLEEQPPRATSGRFWVFHCFIFSSKFSFFSYHFERILTIIRIWINFVKI